MPSSAAPEPIGIAIVGLGHWGPNLLRNISDDPRSKVIYAVDVSAERLSLVANRYPNVTRTASLQVALDDPSVTGVIIATPASTHYQIARQALNAGKHCLVEKPLATSQGEARDLVALAETRHLRIAVGHVFLYNAAIRRVKRYLDAGDLGQVHYISMARTNLGPPGIDVDVVWDLATHDVSIANYWLQGPPTHVAAQGGSWITPGKVDTVFATLSYATGQLVHIVASWLNPRKVRDIVVVGSRYMVTVDDLNQVEPLRIYDKGIDPELTPPFIDTYGEFRASVRDGDIHIPHVFLASIHRPGAAEGRERAGEPSKAGRWLAGPSPEGHD